eukprot:Polyplicarium_translucidae@DN1242_c0_g1_i1.p1
MEKYRRVPREKTPIKQDEIRITASGRLPNYVTYAGHLFNQEEKTSLSIKATGNAIARAVTLAEVVKRRFRGLHQLTKCGSTTITDVYQPIEEGLDSVTHERTVSYIEISLTRDAALFDKDDPGYQAPLDDALVNELPPEEVSRTGHRKPAAAAGPIRREGGGGGGGPPYGRGGGAMYRGPPRELRAMRGYSGPRAPSGRYPARMTPNMPMQNRMGYAPPRGYPRGYGYRPMYGAAPYPMRYEGPPRNDGGRRPYGQPRGFRGGGGGYRGG